MKKWILLLAALLVPGVIYFSRSASPDKSATRLAAGPSPVDLGKSSDLEMRERKVANARPLFKSDEELKAQLIEGYAKQAAVAAKFTPELTRKSMDSLMRRREPMYRRLFETWNMDEAKIGEALRIIRDRETKIHDEQMRAMRDRPAEVGDLSDSSKERASFKRSVAVRDAINVAADMELLVVLGSSDHVQRLKSVEGDLKRKAVAD